MRVTERRRAEDALRHPDLRAWRGKVQMVFTSPPFPLQRAKKYGNLCGDAFADWLAGYAKPLAEFLTPDGYGVEVVSAEGRVGPHAYYKAPCPGHD